jgi:hypothetical protein
MPARTTAPALSRSTFSSGIGVTSTRKPARMRERRAGSSQMPGGPTPAASVGGPVEGAFSLAEAWVAER